MQQQSKSIVSVLLFIIALALAYFGVYGQWNTLSESRTELEVAQSTNDKLKKAQNDANSFLQKYNSNREQAALANRALPKGTPGIPYILDNLSRLTQESGLVLNNLNIIEDDKVVGVPSVPHTIKSLDVDLEAKGTYESYKELLLRIQNNLRITDVVSVLVTASQGEASEAERNVLQYSIKLRTYYQE